MGRRTGRTRWKATEPDVIGVDVALGGGDLTVIQRRQGLAAFPPHVINSASPHEIGDLVAHEIDVFEPDAVFIDNSGGYGSGVISRLEALRYTVMGIQFGGVALDERYVNRRTEMWWKIKTWLEAGGATPNDKQYPSTRPAAVTATRTRAARLSLSPKTRCAPAASNPPTLAMRWH